MMILLMDLKVLRPELVCQCLIPLIPITDVDCIHGKAAHEFIKHAEFPRNTLSKPSHAKTEIPSQVFTMPRSQRIVKWRI